MPQRWFVNPESNWKSFCDYVNGQRAAGKRVTVEIVPERRTIDQNGMIYALYGEIAKQAQDLTVVEVKRHCKLHYGVPLLRANCPEFCKLYDNAIKHSMDYEAKLLLMDYMDITSRKEFSKAMCTEYIDTIIREYSKHGYHLEREEEAA